MGCLEQKGIDLMRKSGQPTSYPGIFKITNKTYRIRGKVIDPRTGKPKEVDRLVENVSLQQATCMRAAMLDALRNATLEQRKKRQRVGEYAPSWMESKAVKLDVFTARSYATILDLHILPALGNYYYDALTRRDVQDWVDRSLAATWLTRGKRTKSFSIDTVYGWFRVLRNMTRDALDELALERDPTLRITFPPRPLCTEAKSLRLDELTRFLAQVHQRYPQHFALTATLVFTGLRFCHASAIRWEDWDEASGVIRIRRKQFLGVVGALTRRKPGPGVCVIEPQLADVLREHRRNLHRSQNPGLAEGWMFPAPKGKLLRRNTLAKAWQVCLEAAGILRRFTIHGTRYTFTDLTRAAAIDPVVRRSLVGHMTEAMQDHYSHIALEEKRAAMSGVYRLVPLADLLNPKSGDSGGDKADEP